VLKDLEMTASGGGVGMAPVIGPKVQEEVTHMAPLTVWAYVHSLIIELTTTRTMRAREWKLFKQLEMLARC
jgi:hypothetical protein